MSNVTKLNLNGTTYNLGGGKQKLYYIPMVYQSGSYEWEMRCVLVDSEDNILKDSGVFSFTSFNDLGSCSDGGHGYMTVVSELLKLLDKEEAEIVAIGSTIFPNGVNDDNWLTVPNESDLQNVPSVKRFPLSIYNSDYNYSNFLTIYNYLSFSWGVIGVFGYVQNNNGSGGYYVFALPSETITYMYQEGFLTEEDLGYKPELGPT
jgi:hypothetical protein